MSRERTITVRINGTDYTAAVPTRKLLSDFIREDAGLTGTHVGCEHGVCGACNVVLDGRPVRACLQLTLACDGAEVTTIEGHGADGVMAALRAAFTKHHGLQCGYCTSGMLVTARDVVLRLADADEARIRLELAGNLCRCTGYAGIVAAIAEVVATRRAAPA